MHQNNTLRERKHNNKTLRLTNASKIFRVASKFAETQNFLSSIHKRLLAFPCTSITINFYTYLYSLPAELQEFLVDCFLSEIVG